MSQLLPRGRLLIARRRCRRPPRSAMHAKQLAELPALFETDSVSFRTITVDQPRYSKAIRHNAESSRPKCFFQRHDNRAIRGKSFEYSLGLSGVLELKGQRETLRRLVAI